MLIAVDMKALPDNLATLPPTQEHTVAAHILTQNHCRDICALAVHPSEPLFVTGEGDRSVAIPRTPRASSARKDDRKPEPAIVSSALHLFDFHTRRPLAGSLLGHFSSPYMYVVMH